MIWLGERRGNLSDWTTQQWVRLTGRRVSLSEQPWLDGPTGPTSGIGMSVFEAYAAAHGLRMQPSGNDGLLPDFHALDVGNPGIASVAPEVAHFYEHTASYTLDAWSEWCSAFRPFGHVLSVLFSKRLQQLNVPLSSLDSSRGMSSDVIPMRDPATSRVVQTAWLRKLRSTGNVIYAGSYSLCRVPGHGSPCIKVVFPLPNGNATVLMKAHAGADGSLSLQSRGERFGDPGFYFTVHAGDGTAWARYVGSMKEEIRVYPDEAGGSRADHTLWIWGVQFLRLHYRMTLRRERVGITSADATPTNESAQP